MLSAPCSMPLRCVCALQVHAPLLLRLPRHGRAAQPPLPAVQEGDGPEGMGAAMAVATPDGGRDVLDMFLDFSATDISDFLVGLDD